MFSKKTFEISSSLQSLLFEKITVKTANVANSHFWIILPENGRSQFDQLQKLFSDKLYIRKLL